MRQKRIIRTSLVGLACMLLSACQHNVSEPMTVQSREPIRVATWNVEHLAFPADTGCKPRSEKDLAQLQTYASDIKADVIGLQEVASKEAVHLLFPESEWQVVVSDRPDSKPYLCRGSDRESTQQKVAFAIRKSLPINTVIQNEEFSLDSPGLRRGLEIQLLTDYGILSVLNVHLKSGCFVDNYSRAQTDACTTFAKQAPVLDAWVEEKEKAGAPYIVLGDFNHRLSAPYNHLTRQLNTNTNGKPSTLSNSTAQLIGCHPYYPAPIDHIFVGHMPLEAIERNLTLYPFENMQVEHMLSDHCAVLLTLQDKRRHHE